MNSFASSAHVRRICYRAFSHDVTAAILVFQTNETAAMLVYQQNPLGVDFFSHVNAFFCSKLASVLATWVKALYRVFSHDVTAAILVSQTNPLGVVLFS